MALMAPMREGARARAGLLFLAFAAVGAAPEALVAADESPPPLRRVRFPAELAQATQANCMDGKPAGYFVREQDPKRWAIFLQGGGLCVSPLDCAARLHGAEKNKGSFDPWLETYPRLDPFDEEPDSPYTGYSQVWLPYCSSDLWLGMDREPRIVTGGYQMSGHLIIDTAIEHLLNNSALRRAEEVLFSGTSAGGIGAIQHADWLEAKLRSAGGGRSLRFETLALAGLFFPKNWPVLFEEFVLGITAPAERFMADYTRMFEGGFVHEGCADAERRTGNWTGRCWDVSTALPFVRGRLFIAENRFDEFQIHNLGLCPAVVCTNSSKPDSFGGRFIRFAGKLMNETLGWLASNRPHIGLFSPGLFDHDRNLMDYAGGLQDFRVAGVTMQGAFRRWRGGEDVRLIQDCGSEDPCTPVPASFVI